MCNNNLILDLSASFDITCITSSYSGHNFTIILSLAFHGLLFLFILPECW